MCFEEKVKNHFDKTLTELTNKYTRKGYIPLISDKAEVEVYGFLNSEVHGKTFTKDDFFVMLSEMTNNAVLQKSKAKEYSDKLYWYTSQKVMQNVLEEIKDY